MLLNWGMYLRLPEAKLGEYLVDIDGHRGFGSVPFGRMPPTAREADRPLAA